MNSEHIVPTFIRLSRSANIIVQVIIDVDKHLISGMIGNLPELSGTLSSTASAASARHF